MTIRSDEITMGNPNFVHRFSYHIIAMWLLYQLIDKRILYNVIPLESLSGRPPLAVPPKKNFMQIKKCLPSTCLQWDNFENFLQRTMRLQNESPRHPSLPSQKNDTAVCLEIKLFTLYLAQTLQMFHPKYNVTHFCNPTLPTPYTKQPIITSCGGHNVTN